MQSGADSEDRGLLNSTSLLAEYQHFIESHALLEQLNTFHTSWSLIARFCRELDENRPVLRALTDLHVASQIDFERAMFCSWMSMQVAKCCSLNLKHQRSLFLAGLLQDYGKHTPDVDVSGFISRVNGPYVSHAFKSRGLDHHPLVSSTFVETHLNEDKRLADLVLHHHAREDGTGFPQHIGENQLPIDHQILIIANEMSDRLDKLGGHNHLLSCLPALRLGKVLYFNKAHAAWLEMLKPLVPDDPAPLSYSECQQLQFKRDHLEKVLSSLLAVSGELLRYDFDLHVHGLRSNIQKIARLFAETGLLNKALFEKACSEEAGGSCQFHDTLIEVQALFKALPETLGRCADQLDYLLNHPEFDVNQVVLSEALARLKRCVAMLTPVRSSIFR